MPTANTTPSAGADPTAITAETGKPAVAETSGTKASPELHLPFSERTDVFSPPKAGLPTTAPSDSNEAPVETIPMLDVALKGFARVKDLRVLLQIEDFIAPLGVGQEKDGIRVVSINPPEVTLASGERQWTLSLSNQFSQSARPRAQQTTDQN